MSPDVVEFRLDVTARTLAVVGELVASADGRLAEAVRELTRLDGAGATRLDLSGVTFLPSSAIGVISRERDAVARRGGELVLVAADGGIASRVLTVMALPHSAA